MYVKLALGNVRRNLRDYSVYFLTLSFAACLLYLFTASGDFLLAMDLTASQYEVYGKAGDIVQAFSLLTVLVFSFLLVYANRFILRRRSREFAIYALLGMGAGRVALILAYEGLLVGAGALFAGVAAGVLVSPLFSGVVSFVFCVPWRPTWVFSAHAAWWTAGCFVAIMALATLAGMRSIGKKTLLQLMVAPRSPERMVAAGRKALGLQLLMGLILVGAAWACCVLQPGYFLMGILPLSLGATLGTCLIFRYAAARVPGLLRRRTRWYYVGLRCFTLRQVEAKISSSALAMACVCVLLAVAICATVAGLMFSMMIRETGEHGGAALNLAPIGFVGILYGLTFMVAAAAVLALHQLSEVSDSVGRYRILMELGVPGPMVQGSIRAQVGTYFGTPLVGALVHSLFGLTLVGFLASAFEATSFAVIVGATLGGTVLAMGLYYALTCAICGRIVGVSRGKTAGHRYAS